jgi:hypothetical protein
LGDWGAHPAEAGYADAQDAHDSTSVQNVNVMPSTLSQPGRSNQPPA